MKRKLIFAALLLGLGACGDDAGHEREMNADGEEGGAQATTGRTEEMDAVLMEAQEEYYDMGEGEATDDEIAVVEDFNTESYAHIEENPFKNPLDEPLSTFSIDVDNASYSNVRRMLEYGEKPPVDAVRIEEFVNYFDYKYAQASEEVPFSVNTELGECPWNNERELLHIGLKGYTLPIEELPASNLVFLIDVSGSMDSPHKLDLLKRSFSAMVSHLNERDRVSLVVYAGSSGVVLEPTSCDKKFLIQAALGRLQAGGSTAGAEGLELAYKLAEESFVAGGNNRIILATDGDFNVGPSSDSEMQRLIESKRDKGIYITVLGFGMGNYKDSKMEAIADHGNGNYFYIDDMREANHTLVDNLAGTLMAIAKDVKIQIEFNPEIVASYRLVGYENRLLAHEDFDNDKKDAGEIGAGHTVTAIYEIVRGNAKSQRNLKFQASRDVQSSEDLAFVKLRYKLPEENTSKLIQLDISAQSKSLEETSENFRFSAAVAAFGMKLRESEHISSFSWDDIVDLANSARGDDDHGLRGEFVQLVKTASSIFGISA